MRIENPLLSLHSFSDTECDSFQPGCIQRWASCYESSGGNCERVVIGSQARLRIWCLVRMGSSPFARTEKRLWFVRTTAFFSCKLRASRYRTPLSLRDISLGRMETAGTVSVARSHSVHRRCVSSISDSWVCALFKYSHSQLFLRASRYRTPLSLRDPTSGVRKNARFAHIMVNFGLVVREKRFSAHEAVFLITRE